MELSRVAGTLSDVSDVETFSHAAKLGGLRSVVIDRYVAAEAAVNVTGPPSGKDAIKPFTQHFLRWLKDARGDEDRELRRRVLLMVTEGRAGQGTSDKDAAHVAEVVNDVYRSIA